MQAKHRFQFHLSTAIMVIIVAGILLGVNFVPRKKAHVVSMDIDFVVGAIQRTVNIAVDVERGFPLPFLVETYPAGSRHWTGSNSWYGYRDSDGILHTTPDEDEVVRGITDSFISAAGTASDQRIFWKGLILDILLGFFILLLWRFLLKRITKKTKGNRGGG